MTQTNCRKQLKQLVAYKSSQTILSDTTSLIYLVANKYSKTKRRKQIVANIL